MLKLILCIFSGLALAAVMLQLREQRLNLGFEANHLHAQIEATQAELWNQQREIAERTAPNAILATVGKQDLKPESPAAPSHPTVWINDDHNPATE